MSENNGLPTGKHTLIESDRHARPAGRPAPKTGWNIDIYKLSLDGSGKVQRLTHFNDFSGWHASNPVVFIASLVPEKGKVVRCIREKCPHAVVALRSVEGLCSLLYDPVDEMELAAMGCGFLGRTRDIPQAINMTLFYEAAPAAQRNRRSRSGGPARHRA